MPVSSRDRFHDAKWRQLSSVISPSRRLNCAMARCTPSLGLARTSGRKMGQSRNCWRHRSLSQNDDVRISDAGRDCCCDCLEIGIVISVHKVLPSIWDQELTDIHVRLKGCSRFVEECGS